MSDVIETILREWDGDSSKPMDVPAEVFRAVLARYQPASRFADNGIFEIATAGKVIPIRAAPPKP